jgi:DNA-binding LytR/AlgR family response regulator
VHKSYIVSLNHVRLLDGNTLYVQDKHIPVSDAYREGLYRVVRRS